MKNIKIKILALFVLFTAMFTACEEEEPILFTDDLLMITSDLSLNVSENSGEHSITIAISNPRNSEFSIPLVISDGTAIQGVDYSVSSPNVTFAAGEREATFTFSIIDNDEESGEEAKVFTISLPSDQGPKITPEASSVTIAISDDDASCPDSITGTYSATTVAETPFDGTYDNTGNPYTVTISPNDDGTLLISDITGGLYGEFYPDQYPNIAVQALPGTLNRNKCEISATDVPEDPAFEAAFGANTLQLTGVIGEEGVITFNFSSTSNDNGNVTLVKLSDEILPPDDDDPIVEEPLCPTNLEGIYTATTTASTPFDGDYNNADSVYVVSITDNGDGTFGISDLTGGLYGEYYPGRYPAIAVTDLPAVFTKNECAITATDVPDDPAFTEAFGAGTYNASGTVAQNGTITYSFIGSAGDTGTVVLEKQQCEVVNSGTYLATTSASTPFDGDYVNNNSETDYPNPYSVTVTNNGDGTISFSDVTGGLYGEYYPSRYPAISVGELPATLEIGADCSLSASGVPDHPAFIEAFGEGSYEITGSIGGDGSISISFTGTSGDTGTVTFVLEE